MEGELLSLKWNNHRSTFYTIISSLRNKELYTDVTLACEGKFYPAHKLVLSTCSEYFSAVFEQTSCKNPVVILKDILCKDLEFLLDYMYIGEVNVRQSELSSLIKAAECLKIKGLAVPDEEPVKPSSRASASRTDQTRESSPPPKRRRQDSRRTSSPTDRNVQRNQTASPQPQAPSDDPPTSLAGDSTSGTNPLTPGSQAQAGGGEDQQAPAPIAQIDHIKVEKEDAEHEEPDFHQTHSNNYEDSGGGGSRGDGVASEGDTVPDFPDFLQHTIEKEEPIALRDFNPSEFPGPSGLQASAIGPWEGEGSSSGYPGEGFPGASATSSQTQQQQLGQQDNTSSSTSLVPVEPSGTITSRIEFGTTQRGNPKLHFGGFSYTKDKRRDSRDYWRCESRGCPGRITLDGQTILSSKDHNHVPKNAAQVQVDLSRDRIKSLASAALEGPLEVYGDLIVQSLDPGMFRVYTDKPA
ncbi:uncharacterized protein LOC143036544 isoform X8 [Oratosquilla oratoria]|uniref:uncharacterized protein LOC143036544 isoform X8 n=1 Tax=Oratosquilla oratoria TaxID=337810 RepID=UPI003F777A2B